MIMVKASEVRKLQYEGKKVAMVRARVLLNSRN
jgi:hypothetical protein